MYSLSMFSIILDLLLLLTTQVREVEVFEDLHQASLSQPGEVGRVLGGGRDLYHGAVHPELLCLGGSTFFTHNAEESVED